MGRHKIVIDGLKHVWLDDNLTSQFEASEPFERSNYVCRSNITIPRFGKKPILSGRQTFQAITSIVRGVIGGDDSTRIDVLRPNADSV